MKIKLFVHVHAKYRHHAKSPAVTANTVVPFCFRYRPSFPASHLLAVDPHSFLRIRIQLFFSMRIRIQYMY